MFYITEKYFIVIQIFLPINVLCQQLQLYFYIKRTMKSHLFYFYHLKILINYNDFILFLCFSPTFVMENKEIELMNVSPS